MIGWGDTPTRVSVSNSIFAGNYNGNGYFHPVGCANHANSISSSAITISNCYFTIDATSNFSSGNTDKPIDQKASNKGKHAYTITGDEGITVTMNGTSTIYDISGIEAYNVGVVYDGQIIAGSGDNVSLNISGKRLFGHLWQHLRQWSLHTCHGKQQHHHQSSSFLVYH